MNWQQDPELARLAQHSGVRGRLLRSTILWSPFFILCFGALVFFTIDRAFFDGDHGGTWFLVIVLSILSLLFGFQTIQSLLDYIGEPRKETGYVGRRWARNDSIVMKAHYIRLGKLILRGDQLILDGIREGDYVEATFYPHSAVLVWVEKQEGPTEDAPPESNQSTPNPTRT
ncbi:MAG: hypothetical protein ABI577_13680 [bacterium]